jgi:hypothetical protein
MTPARQADLQLRTVEICYRHRSPAMSDAELERLLTRSEAILDGMAPSPDVAFQDRLRSFRLELRPVG